MSNRRSKVNADIITSVFDDPLFLTFADPRQSIQERRFIIMGESAQGRGPKTIQCRAMIG